MDVIVISSDSSNPPSPNVRTNDHGMPGNCFAKADEEQSLERQHPVSFHVKRRNLVDNFSSSDESDVDMSGVTPNVPDKGSLIHGVAKDLTHLKDDKLNERGKCENECDVHALKKDSAIRNVNETKTCTKESHKSKKQKQTEQAQAKAFKKAAAEAKKINKPGECLKYIQALLDQSLLTTEFSGELLIALQKAELQYNIQEQRSPKTITWVRTVKDYKCDDDLKVVVSSTLKEEDLILVVMIWNEFIDLLESQQLQKHLQNISALHTHSSKLTLVIYKLEEYFRLQNVERQRNFKNRVKSGQHSMQGPTPTKFSFSRQEVEKALAELQLFYSCSHVQVETAQDLGSLVAYYTKALAERTFRLGQQQEQETLEWFAAGDSRDTVKVDKSGAGLLRLWKQQLCQFHNTSLDTAEAIVSVYPSPRALVQAYEKCSSQKEGELLLQDIPVRRGAGPLTTVRRIGPELSRKIYLFFTAIDGAVHLSQEKQ